MIFANAFSICTAVDVSILKISVQKMKKSLFCGFIANISTRRGKTLFTP